MNFQALCLCDKPAGLRASGFVTDARKRGKGSDPTGTLPLQRRFASALDLRWKQLRKLIPDAVAHKTSAVNIISHAASIGDDPVRSFQAWIDEAMRQIVLGNTGSWTLGYVRQAGDHALLRTGSMVSAQRVSDAGPDRIPQLQTLCVTELQGICEAVSQRAVRAFGNGLLLKWTPSKIARSIQQVIDVIGVKRGHLLVSFFVVRAFGVATLDSFRASGISHVGTVAERTGLGHKPPGSVRDAKPKTYKGVMRAESKLQRLFGETGVDVLTAGDDDVCIECQDISDNGPYTLDEAEGLIPAHPSCRCAFVPADLDDDDDIFDGFDPDEPRDDHGMWSGVGGAVMKSFKPPQTNAEWSKVEGQNHSINEPPLPNLKQKSYSYTDKVTGETKTFQPRDMRLSSGVIMREPDGRTWLIKPTNGFGGYNYTFPKGGVERDLHPQANAIKETFEETGLHARITGWAGDYKGDTSITRMYHAERIGGHPKDKGWETEQVALAHPDDLEHMLNRSRDRKIAKHHILTHDDYDPNEPRDDHGMWTSGGATSFYDLPSLEGIAAQHSSFMHKGTGTTNKYYTFAATKEKPDDRAAFEAAHDPSKLDMSNLTKISGKKGSNEGGVYKDTGGLYPKSEYYIKQPATKGHVTNELLTAKLYQLAGANTLNYVPVNGGEHVATEMESLAKNNVSQLTKGERLQAQNDFAVHAWLANWDAAGTGGDNVGVRMNGDVVTLDTGGGLKYRAQGEPKGAAFGDTVTEINTLRDPSKNSDAAKLYGDMTNDQMVASIKRVTSIPIADINKTIYENGGDAALVSKMISRRDDLAKQALKMSVTPAPVSPPSVAPKTILGHNTTVNPTTAAAPTTSTTPLVFKTKMAQIKHMLLKGATADDLKSAVGWPSMNVPGTAEKLGLKLTKTKIGGGKFHYKGEPMVAGASPTITSSSRTVVSPSTKPSHLAFHSALKEAGVFSHISRNNENENEMQISSSTANKDEMAAVAKNHPQWKLKPNNVATYSASKEAFNDSPSGAASRTSFDPEPAPAAPAHDINTPHGNFAQGLVMGGVDPQVGKFGPSSPYHGQDYVAVGGLDPEVVAEVAKYHPQMAPIPESSTIYAKAGIGVTTTLSTAPPPAPAPVVPKTAPTDAELTKAKKSTKLTAQYVPGAPAGHPEAEKLIAAFNAKYEGNNDLSQGQLVEKVHAFKQLTANMVPLQNEVQKAQAAQASAALAAQAQAQAAKQAADAAKIVNLHNLPEEEQRLYWLQKQGASNYIKGESYIKSKGLSGTGITPAEIGFIRAFTGAHSGVNEGMRNGVMDDETFAFKHIMNEALAKMPVYTGDKVWRKITLSNAELDKYKIGKNIHWTAFSSTAKNPDVWSGNTHFVIHNPKTGVDVQNISANPGEAEVIMPADTYYKVLKKTLSGGITHIEMEEVVPFGKKKKMAA